MELRSAGRSRNNPASAPHKGTDRQRLGLTIPPGQVVETVQEYMLWWKVAGHVILWVAGLTAVVLLHNGWDWVGLSLLMLSASGLGSEVRWKAPHTRTTKKG